MDTLHLNTYLHLIEALLQCAKGEEWLLLQQHEELIDAELIVVMEQVTEQLDREGNTPAAKFLQYWAVQLTHLLQQNPSPETSAANRGQSYLNLIQTLLGCMKGDEVAILSQHPDLLDRGLVHTMNQAAAQLAAKGSQDTAIYLKHLATEVDRVLLHPSEQQTQIAAPPTNSKIENPAERASAPQGGREVKVANKLPQNGQKCSIEQVAPPKSTSPTNDRVNGSKVEPVEATTNKQQPNLVKSPLLDNQIVELLENISNRLEQLERSVSKHQNPMNPLWYMSILEQAAAQGWIISSEEIEQLIGTKPHCAPDRNFFVRGCWKFEKAGKVGMQSSWRVTKETAIPSIVDVTLPSGNSLPLSMAAVPVKAAPSENQTPDPESTELELNLSSPWADN
jgi:hypothetical protein